MKATIPANEIRTQIYLVYKSPYLYSLKVTAPR